ncbi:zinc finger protein OZF-like [Hyposmocoma kahamanoa]|uniref:zinc finger protein OZF-like n=1 Tax=Hyposmocoma kahamanoa TaxID=1477025 RepID=UPI000E6D73A1|nr:zinc finger protein OZF-like [Hyposmocoma kahamanoa]
MPLFAKPKNDNFFSKDNMDNFSKEYQVDIILLSKEDQIKELESRKNTTSYIRADFKCEYCYKGFVIESSYKSHIVFHDVSRGDFSCEICAVRYSTKRQVLTHHRQTHAVNFVCNICGHATKNIKRAKFHYNHHQGVKITCKHCGKQFSQRAQHMNHVRSAHGAARCDICGMLFISATGVSRHKFWQHKEVVGVNCESCSSQFHSTEALNKHRISGCSIDLKPCPACGTNFSGQESLQTHIEEVHWKTDNAFKCSKCSKTYSSERLLKIHLREHRRSQRTGEGVTPSFMCEVCGRSFMDRKYLRDHQRLHTGDKPYQCDVCSKTFRLPSTHRAHMDRHANLRRYQCSICPKTFTQAGHRAAHVRRHTNEKPFACSTCGRRFSCSGNARHHLRAVHMGIRRNRKPPAGRCEPST